jgi:hypothetical protein
MGTAYQCKEEYTPDGKRLVRRERSFGDSMVAGAVALVLLATVLVLVLTGHATVAVPISVGGVLESLRRLRQ